MVMLNGKALQDYSLAWITKHRIKGTSSTPLEVKFIQLLSEERSYDGEPFPKNRIPCYDGPPDVYDEVLTVTPEQLNTSHMVVLEDGTVVANGFGWPDGTKFGVVLKD